MFETEEPQEGCKVQSWKHEKVEQGTFFKAWKAGKTFGVNTHYVGRTVPCWSILTRKQIECPHCRNNPSLIWKGYVPLYRDTNRPVLVMIGREQKEPVAKIEVHEPVHVWRLSGKGNSIALRPDDWSKKRWQPPGDYAGVPDIRPALLILWKEPRLSDFFREHGMAQNTESAPAHGAAGGDSPPASAQWQEAFDRAPAEVKRAALEQRAARDRKASGGGVGELSELAGDIARRAAAEIGEQPNGKHKGGAR